MEFSLVIDKMTANAPSDRYESAQAVLNALRPVKVQSNQVLATPTPVPAPSIPAPSVSQVQVYPQITPPKPLVLPPLGNQLFAAFSIGFESGLLSLFAYHVLSANFGPFGYAISGGLILLTLWLRISQILDNKDLLIFVNGLTLLAMLISSLIWKFSTLPTFFELLLLGAVAGCFMVALAAFARLVYQILYKIF
jgi:hypothetical protein